MVIIIVGALIIGLTLGLLGSGGSILTVPVLVYMLGHDGKTAIAESLAIVGGIAVVATLPYAVSRQIDWRSVVFFGAPGMAGTYLGAWLAKFVPGSAQLVLFALVMLLAAWMMFRRSSVSTSRAVDDDEKAEVHDRHAVWKIGLEGMSVGVLTGLVGVGGGFLIVPALVILGRLPMRIAVGTSLAVIALNSFIGLYRYVDVLESVGKAVDWRTVAAFVLVGVVGSFAGRLISARLNQQMLRKGFAAFLIVMGLFVLAKEAPGLLTKPTGHKTVATASSRADVAATTHSLSGNHANFEVTSGEQGVEP